MTSANKLRRQDIIRDSARRYWEIVELQHKKMARMGGLVTVDFVEIPSGKKSQKKLKSNVDEMDVVDAPVLDMYVTQLVDAEGHPVRTLPAGSNGMGLGLRLEGVEPTYRQTIALEVDKFFGAEKWHDVRFLLGMLPDVGEAEKAEVDDDYSDGETSDDYSDDDDDGNDEVMHEEDLDNLVKLLVRYDNDLDVPISVNFPERFQVEVKDCDEGNANLNDNWKKALLVNGISVRVPGFISVGDVIVVNARDKSYVEKA